MSHSARPPTRSAPSPEVRVLVVEDSQINQVVTAAMLRTAGIEPEVVGTGQDALTRLREESFDLVLMDISLPDMDGFETTRAIRASAEGRTVPIIAITAHALDGDRERCLAAGMNDYVSKPVDRAEFLRKVRRWTSGDGVDPRTETMDSAQGIPVIDAEVMKAFIEEMDRESLPAILDIFISEIEERMQNIAVAMDEDDLVRIGREAHSLKSMAAQIGAMQLNEHTRGLEAAAAARDVAQVAARIPPLQPVGRQAVRVLGELRSRIAGGG